MTRGGGTTGNKVIPKDKRPPRASVTREKVMADFMAVELPIFRGGIKPQSCLPTLVGAQPIQAEPRAQP